jgi:hypothetical protein
MWRYFVGGAGALVLAFAAMFLFRGSAEFEPKLPPSPVAQAEAQAEDALPAEAPRATERTREQKRFDRLDKDKSDAISRDEFLNLRRRAFAKLDANGDGRLSFDEWAIRSTTRFGTADKDKSGALTRAEFATTAPKRRAQPRCACPKPAAKAAAAREGADETESTEE